MIHAAEVGRPRRFVHEDVSSRARNGGDACAEIRYRMAMENLTDLIFDASLLPALFVAVLAGVLSFLSPCVLPIVPPYLAYMGGVSVSDMGSEAAARRRALIASLFFVLGLSTVFLIMGASASTLGRMVGGAREWLTKGSAVIIMIFGAHFIGVFRLSFMDRELRVEAKSQGGSSFGAYLLGLAFAFGWTPCLGPILGTILGLATGQDAATRGAVLLIGYALGLGLPFILVAAFFPRLKGPMAFMRRHMGRIEKISGLLLWTIGLMMLTDQFSALAFWLLETFPALAKIG